MSIFSRSNLLRIKVTKLKQRLKKALPSRFETGAIYSTPEGRFAVPTNDLFFPQVLRQGKAYGVDEIERIRAIVPAGASILVVGGHVGTLAIPLARTASRVTVVEANPDTFKFLAANVALNGCDNITLLQMAAGEADGAIEFIANRDNTGGSKRSPVIADSRYTYDNPDRIQVVMKRLDDVLEGTYDALIMDIEGSEYFALKGMPRALSNIRTIFIEFISHHLRNVAGVSTDQFYDALGDAFDYLEVPGDGTSVTGPAIRRKLAEMYAQDRSEDVIVFSKGPLPTR